MKRRISPVMRAIAPAAVGLAAITATTAASNGAHPAPVSQVTHPRAGHLTDNIQPTTIKHTTTHHTVKHMTVKPKPRHHKKPCAMPYGMNRWVCNAVRILHHHGYGYVDTGAIWIIAEGESGLNPDSGPWTPGYNCDSNCTAGIPSEGLMQEIPAAMTTYGLPGHQNRLNPVDAIIAAAYYTQDRYGSLSNTPGVVAVRGGGSYVGY